MSALPMPSAGEVDESGVQASAVDGLSSIPAPDWDRLVGPGSAPLSHGFLSAWETSELPGLESRPVVARRDAGGPPVAASPGYLYDLDMVGIRLPAAAPVMGILRQVRPRLLLARTYELGNPTPLTNPFLVADGEDRSRAVAALAGAALEEADRSDADFVVVQNLSSLDGPAARALRPAGFAGVPIPPTVVVDLPYDSFDAYLGAMRAQYRRRARQAMDRSAHLSVEIHADFAPLAEDLASLWGLIYERATEIRRERLTPAFFTGVSALPDTSVLVLRRPDGSISSFALLMAEGSWMSFLQCGFDRRSAEGEGTYFRLLYEIVRAAIDGGHRQLELGMTTITPKLDIGGVPVPLYALVRHRNPVLQRVIRLYADRLVKADRLEPRRVFKDDPPSAAELLADRALYS